MSHTHLAFLFVLVLLLIPADDGTGDAADAEELHVLVQPEEHEELVDEKVGACLIVCELCNARGDRCI